jgi:hypothetical protein
MNVASQLELAIAELILAKELAEFFGYPAELVERIDLVTRATAKVRKQAQQIPDSQYEIRATCRVVGSADPSQHA